MPHSPYDFCPATWALRHAVSQAERLAKEAPLVVRPPLPHNCSDPGDFWVLRRWNSHTPAITDVRGGGYYLRWDGHGIVIDPGYTFLRSLEAETPYGIEDVNMVLASHDHVDHCGDLPVLIALHRQRNKRLVRRGQKPKMLDLLISYGVADQLGGLLDNPENDPFVRWRRVFPNADVDQVQMRPQFAPGRSIQTNHWDEPARSMTRSAYATLEKAYGLRLRALQTYHREYLGEDSGIGAEFQLIRRGSPLLGTLVLAGDTALGRDQGWGGAPGGIAEQYKDAGLLVLHVGSMEGPKEQRLGEHLGLSGVATILEKLAHAENPRLVLLSEWGFEFRLVGGDGRAQFTEAVVAQLRSRAHNYCTRYGSATWDSTARARAGLPANWVPIVPADLGLRIHLDAMRGKLDPRVYIDPNTHIEPREVLATETDGEITYSKV